jgi:hypothetical protein
LAERASEKRLRSIDPKVAVSAFGLQMMKVDIERICPALPQAGAGAIS